MALVNSLDSFAAYIFDYGGVLVEHQSDADQQLLADLAGIPKDRFYEAYWARRLDYDLGRLTRAQYWQALASSAGKNFSQETIDRLAEADIQSWMRFDESVWHWIDQLRHSGKRVAMLSNMPHDLGHALRSRTSRLAAFDHVTLSYELGVAKPDAAAYVHCLKALGARPEHTVFFDDRLPNVEAASRLGLHGVHFTSRDQVLGSHLKRA
jgi:putative hydrolase of the HAD superfamily